MPSRAELHRSDVNLQGAHKLPRQTTNGIRLLALRICVGATLTVGLASGNAEAQSRPSGVPVPVSVAKVARVDLPYWLRGLGSVQAFNAVQLRPRVDGTILRVAVTEGQEVRQGDLLVVIDPRPYQATLDAALAKKQQDEALLANAQADVARYAALAAREAASRQKLEAVQALAKQLTATIASDDALIEAAKLNLSFCYVVAPFDGRIGLRSVDPGTFVRAAESVSLMPIAQLRPISATFTLPQDLLGAVAEAMARGKVVVAAYASDDRTLLDEGVLLTMENTVDASTGTIKLKATFENAQNRLWPGQFINARLLLKTEPGVLTVPSMAVQHGPAGLFTYVVKPDQTVARQMVEISRDDGRLTVVTKGLEDGQTVVVNGQSRLQAGSRIADSEAGKPKAEPTKTGG